MSEKIGLFAGRDRGMSVLSALIEKRKNVTDVLVFEQQEHEINNCTDEIVELCHHNNINVKTTEEIRPGDYCNYLKAIGLDVLFVVSWSFLIPEECFNIPSKGIFIIHDSLLPKYRGFAPTNWSIINQEKTTGVTLCYVHKDVDAGDIIDQERMDIEEEETVKTLNEKFLRVYPKIILRNMDAILEGKNRRMPQDNSKATYGCKRNPEDGRIDFGKSTKEIVSLIRGLTYPYPGAFCYYRDQKVFIWEAEEIDDPPEYVGRIAGRIVELKHDFAKVLTGDGMIKIRKIGLEKDMNTFLSPKDVLRSILYKLY